MSAAVRYAIGELATLGGVSRRTVRYYVQEGLISAPLGLGRGNHYTPDHLEQLLRVKGVLEIVGQPRPIVLQAVQRLFHPPAELASWPEGRRLSQIVFITRGLTREFVLEVLHTLQQRVPAAPGRPVCA